MRHNTSHWSRGPACTGEPELGEKDPSWSLQGSSLHCLYRKLSPCFEMADSMSSKVKKAGVNVIGSALKICKMAFRGQWPSPDAVCHPCSPEALYCSSPVWLLTLNLTFLPLRAQGCGTGIRNISYLLFLIHLILFRFCTEKGRDCFPWSVAVGREMNTKSWLRLECCAASGRDDLFPKQVPGMVLSSGSGLD